MGALCAAAPAFAQSDYCGQLRAQLAAVGGGGGRDSNGANLQALYRELSVAQGQANAYGCRQGFFIFGGGGGPECPAILSRIRTLQQTINGLQRNSFFDGPGNAADRIRQDMARAGCETGSGGVGQGRTVCVRVCDGYYFPISFSADRSRFKRDEATCQAMYPPGQAALFIDGDADGNTDDMVSLDGKRYRDQPYALAYRDAYNASCPMPRASASALVRTASIPAAPPLPSPKPGFGEDPDTSANLAADFTPRPITPQADKTTRSVRVVGPSYFYSFGDETPAADSPPPPKAGNEANEAPQGLSTAGIGGDSDQPVVR
jgi:hypothetical protein